MLYYDGAFARSSWGDGVSVCVQVQEDIVGQLRMREPLRLLSSMDRPNIRYSVCFTDLLKSQVRSSQEYAGDYITCFEL